MSEFWTPWRVETLRQMWADGAAASEIAPVVGAASRSAVIGKIHRLGLQRSPEVQKATDQAREARARLAEARKRERVRRAQVKAERRAMEALDAKRAPHNSFLAVNAIRRAERPKGADYNNAHVPVVDASKAKPWTERRFGECAYPISGEGADTYSCCQPTEATYCRAHAAIMFIPLKEAPSRYARSLRRWAA